MYIRILVMFLIFVSTINQAEGTALSLGFTPTNTNGVYLGRLTLVQGLVFGLVFFHLIWLSLEGTLPIRVDLSDIWASLKYVLSGGNIQASSTPAALPNGTDDPNSNTNNKRLNYDQFYYSYSDNEGSDHHDVNVGSYDRQESYIDKQQGNSYYDTHNGYYDNTHGGQVELGYTHDTQSGYDHNQGGGAGYYDDAHVRYDVQQTTYDKQGSYYDTPSSNYDHHHHPYYPTQGGESHYNYYFIHRNHLQTNGYRSLNTDTNSEDDDNDTESYDDVSLNSCQKSKLLIDFYSNLESLRNYSFFSRN